MTEISSYLPGVVGFREQESVVYLLYKRSQVAPELDHQTTLEVEDANKTSVLLKNSL